MSKTFIKLKNNYKLLQNNSKKVVPISPIEPMATPAETGKIMIQYSYHGIEFKRSISIDEINMAMKL